MLNDLGSQGWELVSMIGRTGEVPDNAKIHGYILKRTRLE